MVELVVEANGLMISEGSMTLWGLKVANDLPLHTFSFQTEKNGLKCQPLTVLGNEPGFVCPGLHPPLALSSPFSGSYDSQTVLCC